MNSATTYGKDFTLLAGDRLQRVATWQGVAGQLISIADKVLTILTYH